MANRVCNDIRVMKERERERGGKSLQNGNKIFSWFNYSKIFGASFTHRGQPTPKDAWKCNLCAF